MTARGVPPAPPTSKSFQNVCPIFVQNFAHFLSKILSIFCPKLCPFFLSIFCWGGHPWGPPQLGVPPGTPPPVGGYPRGQTPPPDGVYYRPHTEYDGKVMFSVCLSLGGYPRGPPPSWAVSLGGRPRGYPPPPQLGGGAPGVPPNWGGAPGGTTPQLGGRPPGVPPNWGGAPGGTTPPTGGAPPGYPPNWGGGRGYPPSERQTENITFPSYSVCGR